MKQKIYPSALTIAGSDSGGGAGIQADLKTFSSLGVYGTSVITAITAQNTCGVTAVQPVSPDMIAAQAEAVCSDIPVHALKLGMLHSPDTVDIVVALIRKYKIPFVITDPVMVATSGDSLIQEETILRMEQRLFPLTTILTPNTQEASRLTGIQINTVDDMLAAGKSLLDKGCKSVLMKGGHFDSIEKTDIFLHTGKTPVFLSSPHIETVNTHGTGCTLSSAIAAYLALGHIRENRVNAKDVVNGADSVCEDAVRKAKNYISMALDAGKEVRIGNGHGPVNHFFNPKILTSVNQTK